MIVKPGVINDWDLMERQVQFYRDHLDIFIEDQFAPIKLTPTQHIIAREFGRCSDSKDVCSRGYGKTFLIALCAFAMCCLYPGTIVYVCSGTAQQATLVFGKLKELVDSNPNMAAELKSNGARSLVQLSKDKGSCYFKNGSYMTSSALESARGLRAKIVIIDEALMLSQEDIDAIVKPLANFRRTISRTYNFKDYDSKFVAITSACEKNNTFYEDFKRVVREMAQGNTGAFACALSYEAAIGDGITDEKFFMEEKARMSSQVFDMEYGSIFVGAMENSAFPYSLTEPCRTLEYIELAQPKNSKSRYVIGVDIATSAAKGSDNTIISVIKFTERNDGSFMKKIVYIRSMNGKGLDVLANEIRKIYHKRFPNAERIVYDARGVGDAFSKFFIDPWLDVETGKEYPPLVHDDEPLSIPNAQPKLHPIRAVQTINQHMANTMRVFLEKQTLQIPKSSRLMQIKAQDPEEKFKMSEEEYAVFLEADALQFEMGNIVCKVGASGSALYDTPRAGMHKDRYSSIAMACDYVGLLEDENIKKHKRGPICWGIASKF